jgi:hypothetical protein
VEKGVVDVEDNEASEKIKINTLPVVQHTRNDGDDQLMRREDVDAECVVETITTEVHWLVNPRSIEERRGNGEIAALSAV